MSSSNATTPKSKEASSSTGETTSAAAAASPPRDAAAQAETSGPSPSNNNTPKSKPSTIKRQISGPSQRKKPPPATLEEEEPPPNLPSLSGSSVAPGTTVSTSKKKKPPTSLTAAPQKRPPPEPGATQQVKEAFEEHVGKPGRDAVHKFFYPPNRQQQQQQGSHTDKRNTNHNTQQSHRKPPPQQQQQQQVQQRIRQSQDQRESEPEQLESPAGPPRQRPSRGRGHAALAQQSSSSSQLGDTSSPPQQQQQSQQPHHAEFDQHFSQQQDQDDQFVSHFWHIYDDLIFLSLFTQLGIVARLGSSLWFSWFDGVFSNDSALFVNLPLNCLSCFLLGVLCSGEACMQILTTRFSPPRLQHQLAQQPTTTQPLLNDHDNDDDEEHSEVNGLGHSRSPITLEGGGSAGLSPTSPRVSPASLKRAPSDDSGESLDNRDGIFRRRPRRRPKRDKQQVFRSWQPPVNLNEDLRDVQLLALERRIRQSKCLVLFPVKKEDIDLMEHYFDEGYKKKTDVRRAETFDDEDMDALYLQESYEDDSGHDVEMSPRPPPPPLHNKTPTPSPQCPTPQPHADPLRQTPTTTPTPPPQRPQPIDATTPSESVELHGEQNPTDIHQIVHEVSANVTENISRLRRVNIANGWDVGTSYDDMSDDLMLGLRFGFCGALSSFSSWNSAMLNLIRHGKIGEAFVGYALGIQLPIIGYRFGQHVAVYIFVWRCRQETKRDERRGYGIQLHTNAEDDDDDEQDNDDTRVMRRISSDDLDELPPESPVSTASSAVRNKESTTIDSQTPSIRAVITVIFIMAVVTQCTSISFYSEPQNQLVALSLLFSPLGVLTRWRLSKYNAWRPTFPIGTFTCNILACALSGGLGRLLAGNPNEEERLVLQSLINGFGGTLSSVANFIVEILAGMDPILFRFDGVIYALWSVFWAMVVGFLFTASADWADDTGSS